MANLVRLMLDKDSGDIVAKEQTVPGGTFETAGFRFTQDTPATPWVITHAGGTEIVIVQVYDQSNQQIIPDSITVVNPFRIEITFAEAQAGVANILMVLA
jgi:hypothetical protein